MMIFMMVYIRDDDFDDDEYDADDDYDHADDDDVRMIMYGVRC